METRFLSVYDNEIGDIMGVKWRCEAVELGEDGSLGRICEVDVMV